MNENRPLAYTPAEFAKLFKKSQTWAYRQLYSGKIEGITEFGRVMIPASEAEKILGTAARYLGAQTTPKKATEANLPKEEGILEKGVFKNEFRKWIIKRRNGSSPYRPLKTRSQHWKRRNHADGQK